MKIGIVGSEAAKFTSDTEHKARNAIRRLLSFGDIVISGKCHLGGIDIWAVEEAALMGLDYIEYPPKKLCWSGGYRERNLRIAIESDRLFCITVRELPDSYIGMRFEKCYHCGIKAEPHIKSGGCWTMKQAKKFGKETALIVI